MKFPHLKSPLVYKVELPIYSDMEAALLQFPFLPLEPYQLNTHGFIANPVTGEVLTPSSPVSDGSNRGYSFVMRFAEKLIPAAVVKARVAERVDEIEKEQLRKVGRKEKAELREDVIMSIAPTALVKTKDVHAFYSFTSRRLYLSGASKKHGDVLTSTLVKLFGAITAQTVYFDGIGAGLTSRLSGWLHRNSEEYLVEHGEAGASTFGPFTVGTMVQVIDPNDGLQTTTHIADDLSDEKLGLQGLMLAGYQVGKIELYNGSLGFVLDSKFRLSKIGFASTVDSMQSIDGEEDEAYTWRVEADARVAELNWITDKLIEMLAPPEAPPVDGTVSDLI